MNKKFIIKNVANFRDNYLADYINQYIKNDNFYNLGWGNLSEDLIKFEAPKIDFNKKIISRYGDPQGIDDLINEVIKFVRKKSDTKIEKENMLITNGATNAIFLLSYFFKRFLGINKILLQNPTYDTAINIFKSQDYNIQTINPDLNKIENNNIELAYLMFKFQNPTGVYIEKERAKEFKSRLLKKCYLIEDDSYGLLEDDSEINIIDNKKYLYVSSFSKYIFPGLRMGYIIAHKNVIDKLRTIQKYYTSHPNILSQLILLDYLKTNKIYDEIINKNKILNMRRKLFEDSLSPKTKELIQHHKGGFYYWFKLPNSINLNQLFIELLKNKILVIPGDIYFLNNKYNAIRVSISPINDNDIPIATNKLSDIVEKYV
ncbi:MAG: PLP-dependent aminotransferase family protein [Patescibacteria group bacterium]